jgi:hypothetical protein
MFVCQFCSKEYKTKSSLNYHIKSSKKCLSNRNISNIEQKFICDFCDTNFTKKICLSRHLEVCKDKIIKNFYENKLQEKNNEITILKEKIECLKEENEKLHKLAQTAIEKSTTTTNIKTNYNINNNINLMPITEDYINQQAQFLTIEHIKKGALGYSTYFLDYPLKDRILCTDFSRRKFKYKNEKGDIIIDPEMTNLSNLLFKSIKDKNRELSVQYINDINKKIENNSNTLEYWMDIASTFSEQDLEVLKMFNGEKNNFFHDIIRNISCKTIEK